jgi:hypothetical protein
VNPAVPPLNAESAAPARGSDWVRRLLPWVVTLAVLAWLLWPYRSPEGRAILMQAFTRASAWTFAIGALGTVAMWLTDSYATARTFQRWGIALGLRPTLAIRGTGMMFDAINPTLGQAVLTLVVHRRGTPLSHALIVVLLMSVVFLQHIAVFSGIGLLSGAAPEGGLVPVVVLTSLGLTAIYLLVIALRPAVLAKNAICAWLMGVGLSGHAWAFLYRLPNMIAIIGTQVAILRCFDIDLPLNIALFYLPTVIFIVGIPLSVQGLGPGQVASVAFFAAYAQGEPAQAEATVMASSFAFTLLTTLYSALIGLGCLTTETGRQSITLLREPSTVPQPTAAGHRAELQQRAEAE